MNIENPAALHFIMQDELFLIKADKNLYNSAVLPVVADTKTEQAVFNYLGGKKKNFLILVHYPEQEFIHEVHLSALENILKRKGYELDDVAIVNIAKHTDTHFELITDHFKPEKLLLLGQNSLPKGITALNLNEPQDISGCAALYSFSFDEMMDNNDHKRTFWEQMKLL